MPRLNQPALVRFLDFFFSFFSFLFASLRLALDLRRCWRLGTLLSLFSPSPSCNIHSEILNVCRYPRPTSGSTRPVASADNCMRFPFIPFPVNKRTETFRAMMVCFTVPCSSSRARAGTNKQNGRASAVLPSCACTWWCHEPPASANDRHICK